MESTDRPGSNWFLLIADFNAENHFLSLTLISLSSLILLALKTIGWIKTMF